MIKLRHYQAEVTPAVIKYVRKNPGKHPLVALPTGSGKTFCIAELIRHCREKWDTKVLVLSHVKEILEQNHASLSDYIGEEIGLNSAGLDRRENLDITVAGIQSVYRNPEQWSDHNLIIVDEAHLISPNQDTMYRKFFAGCGSHTIVGFTATPFRLGSGYIYGHGNLFDSIVCDWTSSDRFVRLVDEGYLARLTTKRTEMEMDVDDVKITGGDFNEQALSDKFDRKAVTEAAIREIIKAGSDRNKWLIFAIDISHAEHIAETLIRSGISCAPVHSRMEDDGFDRARTIEGFKNGKYRCVVNVNILTTGFDEPGIDLIAMLRPTKSPVLHVQSLGRGSRISQDKESCLVLDFAGNTARLGPINDVQVAVKGKGASGEPVTKTCPKCQSILPPAVKYCPDCGHEFKFKHGLDHMPTNYDVIDNGKPAWIKVDKVSYSVNSNFGAPSSVMVTYHCGNKDVNEFINIEHKGFALHKAKHWIKYRGGQPCNTAVDVIAQSEVLSVPKKILVQKKGKYFEIKDAQFEE